MPEVQNLDLSVFRQNSIVHVQWRMLKASDVGVTADRRAEIREVLQHVDMIEKAISKALSGSWMMLPRPIHDLFQVS
jgi:hypothetical protein